MVCPPTAGTAILSQNTPDRLEPLPLNGRQVRWVLTVPRWFLWTTAATATAAAIAYTFLDLPAAQWFHGLDDATRDPVKRIANHATELGASKWYFYALPPTIVLLWALKCRVWAAKVGLLLASLAAAGLIVNVLKVVFGRARPDAFREIGAWGFDPFSVGYDYNSFPSGHSAVAGAVAMSLVFIAPRLWPLFALLGLIVGSTRVFTESHYIADVIAGLYVGAMTAVAFRRLWHRAKLWDDPRALLL